MDIVAICIAAIALVVSYLSWRSSQQANRAVIYDQRFQIYLDAERFIQPWIRNAHPDMDLLPILIRAWTRSHFLCREDVTQYLKKVWQDAIEADYAYKILAGEAQGDRNVALQKKHDLLLEHANFEKLREKFMPDLKI